MAGGGTGRLINTAVRRRMLVTARLTASFVQDEVRAR
jgi:hypothetical protein